MAEALVIRVGHLFAEFFAHTLVFFCAFTSAGAVAACLTKTFLNHVDYFLVGIKSNFHIITLFNAEAYCNGLACLAPCVFGNNLCGVIACGKVADCKCQRLTDSVLVIIAETLL